MSASITDTGARLLKLRGDDRQILLVASLAGGFSAIVGTPFAGIVFAVQLTRRRGPLFVLTSAAAAFAGYYTVRWLGNAHSEYPHLPFRLDARAAVQAADRRRSVGRCGRPPLHVDGRLGDAVDVDPRRLAAAATGRRRAWPRSCSAALVGRDYLGLSLPCSAKPSPAPTSIGGSRS